MRQIRPIYSLCTVISCVRMLPFLPPMRLEHAGKRRGSFAHCSTDITTRTPVVPYEQLADDPH